MVGFPQQSDGVVGDGVKSGGGGVRAQHGGSGQMGRDDGRAKNKSEGNKNKKTGQYTGVMQVVWSEHGFPLTQAWPEQTLNQS